MVFFLINNIVMFNLNEFISLLLAAGLTGLIGLEREIHGREAGIRTHFLVGLGSCLAMIISKHVAGTDFDPGRIAAQVISGIGFIGAGTIIKMKNNVRGLTTAACLWSCSVIGLACGNQLFELSIMTTILSITFLLSVRTLEKVIGVKDQYKIVSIIFKDKGHIEALKRVKKIMRYYKMEWIDFEAFEDSRKTIKYAIDVKQNKKTNSEQFLEEIKLIDCVIQVEWKDSDG